MRADAGLPGHFLLDDGHAQGNGFVQQATHRVWGDYWRWGPTVSFSGTPGRYGPGVLAGEQTDTILAELGYEDAERSRLRAGGVVWSEDVPDIEDLVPG